MIVWTHTESGIAQSLSHLLLSFFPFSSLSLSTCKCTEIILQSVRVYLKLDMITLVEDWKWEVGEGHQQE